MTDESISDYIGTVGENFFDNLAIKARLLSGKIDPDRQGKDRIVEFKLENRDEHVSYDKRPAPLSCVLQIKTILIKNHRVALSLSVAERLAGDLRPTVICIFRINESEDITEMYFVHLLGDNLARILKRLRKAYAEEKDALNKAEISFDIDDGQKIELLPNALKEAIVDISGSDMEHYALEKARQRSDLGFDNANRFTATMRIEADDPKELVDGALGLTKLSLTRFQLFEERFQIKLPHNPTPDYQMIWNTVEVQPRLADTGIIKLSNPHSEIVAEINCEILVPALGEIPTEFYKFIARGKLLEASVADGRSKLRFTGVFDEEQSYTVSEWINAFRAWQLCSSEGTVISLSNSSGAHVCSGEISDGMDRFTAHPSTALDLFEKLEMLRNEANAQNRPISIKELRAATYDILRVHAYFFDVESLSPMTFKTFEGTPFETQDLSALFIDIFQVGPDLYAYALELTLRWTINGDCLEWASRSMRALDIETVPDKTASFQRFAERLRKIRQPNLMIAPDEIVEANGTVTPDALKPNE